MNQLLTLAEATKRESLRLHKPRVHEKVLAYDDKYARGESIAIIQLQYSYRCNMVCEHCSISEFRRERGRRMLTPADVATLCDQADQLGLAHLDLTGGEPLTFPDLQEVVQAIGPERFYLQVDTNGWLMTPVNATRLKSLGVDKVQLSIDSLSADEHDAFRRRKGSWARTMTALRAIQDAGLSLQVATVLTSQRVRSPEFIEFLEEMRELGAATSIVWAKPVGEWAGNLDGLPTPDDAAFFASLRGRFNVYDHLTPCYGLDIGCLAVKRMISVTAFGDVLPCPWMYFSLGNIFEESLADILARGMSYFGARCDHCLVSQDMDFIQRYVSQTWGRNDLPLPIQDVMGPPNADR